MTTTIKREAQALTRRQRKGRAVNAVADLLNRRLSVPNIYLAPRYPFFKGDVLAVDRAGSGDLHVVLIKLEDDVVSNPAPFSVTADRRRKLNFAVVVRSLLQGEIKIVPAHYKYLAIPNSLLDRLTPYLLPKLYSTDGIGRIGVIAIADREESLPTAEVVIAPERFRVDASSLRLVEKKLLEKVRPDIEVRI